MDCLKKIWQNFIHPEKLQVPYHLDCQTSMTRWLVQSESRVNIFIHVFRRKIVSTTHRPLGLSLGLFNEEKNLL